MRLWAELSGPIQKLRPWLPKRPREFVSHMMGRILKGLAIAEGQIRQAEAAEDTLLFMVHCQSKPGYSYRVSLGDKSSEYAHPACACEHWERNHRPCKHLCAVCAQFPSWSWDDLPDEYMNNVYFRLDDFAGASPHVSTKEASAADMHPHLRAEKGDADINVPNSFLPHGARARACREELSLWRDMTCRVAQAEALNHL